MNERIRRNPAPANRRRFNTQWDELLYLYDKLLFWLYSRNDQRSAKKYATRINKLVRQIPHVLESAKGNECMALVAEANLDWELACKYRREEIRLIARIRELAHTEKPLARKAILRDFSAAYLADRYDLLAIALWNTGCLEEALSALDCSERLCQSHRMKFDGADLRADILREIDARGNNAGGGQ